MKATTPGSGNRNNKKLSPERRQQLLGVLKGRFEKNRNHHEGLAWDRVQMKLEASPEKLWSLNEMELTGGANRTLSGATKPQANTSSTIVRQKVRRAVEVSAMTVKR